MSEHKHTPGPWVVDKGPSTRGGNGFTVRAGGAIICTAFPGASTDRIEPVAELNARLIAAAPETAAERDRLREVNAELVAALKNLLSTPDFDGTQKTSIARRETKRAARAAIAKVTGGEA